jgi:F0F1-type ATP synthase assembly protein I
VPEPEPELTEAELDYQAHLEQRDVEPDPIELAPPPRRSQTATTSGFATTGGGAEQMSPDPVVDDDEVLDLAPDVDFSEVLDKHASDDEGTVRRPVPSYLRSSSDTLFGGQSVADDLARRGRQPGPEDIDLGDDDARGPEKETSAAPEGSAFVRGVWVVVQCILAVAFGAGLFIAFDQLWRWNTIVALVLSVLVILGLVVGVRVVRKTEDIGSTLIAVAVGALVTLGPLALLQSH